jgi:fido (protein-threonine AMPylation protein)
VADPYAWPGSETLRNKLGIHDAANLKKAEYRVTIERMTQATTLRVAPGAQGYRQLHAHIFQDVYDWAGETRSVDISKPGAFFARAQFIARELDRRFEIFAGGGPLKGTDPKIFADRVAEHLVELNAIHPFREGNGRTMRAHLQHLARDAGQDLALHRIDPAKWIAASITGMQTTDHRPMRDVVLEAIKSPDRIAGDQTREAIAHQRLIAAVVKGALGADPAAAARVMAAGVGALKAKIDAGATLRPAEVTLKPPLSERTKVPADRER